MSTPSTMLAAVLHAPGPASSFRVEHVPIPKPSNGQALIRVHAFGLNRSEMYTRQGLSPGITFPRILGIEAVGTLESAPGSEDRLKEGDVVATIMGNMGRMYDGGYSEWTLVPATQVKVVEVKDKANVDWKVLGALPEMLQTAWGSTVKAMGMEKNDRLLIRGGTSSVGLAAIMIAKKMGVYVAATTRQSGREKMLREVGADDVIVDSGLIAEEVHMRYPGGFSKVLELVGTTTMKDSLKCTAYRGVLCATGYTGDKFSFDDFTPGMDIPPGVFLTNFGSSVETFMEMPFDEYVEDAMEGKMNIPTKVYKLQDIGEAHQAMEDSTAGAKIVVLT